jgi:type IV secretion system protein VirB9
MRQFETAAVSLLSLAALSSAASADPRFKARTYVKNEIVTLEGKLGIESAVAFAPDERIENIAVGNSSKWDVNPNKRANVIFFKPTAVRARTNMTVITNQHVYLFDLVSSGAGSPAYMVQFTYPDAPKPPPGPPALASTAGTAIAERAPVPPQPISAALNFGWRATGEKRLLPASCFDDGSFTFLHWSAEVPLPAILVRGFDGTEGPVNYAVKGDTVVVDGVPAQIILRSGKQLAALTLTRRPPPTTTQTAAAEAVKLRTSSGRADQ